MNWHDVAVKIAWIWQNKKQLLNQTNEIFIHQSGKLNKKFADRVLIINKLVFQAVLRYT